MKDEEQNAAGPENPPSEQQPAVQHKLRSCTGCLYHSSHRRQSGRNPLCVGFSRPDKQVYAAVSDAELEALRDGKKLLEFKYACLGYSVYKQASASDTELPGCLGIEFQMFDPKSVPQPHPQDLSPEAETEGLQTALPGPVETAPVASPQRSTSKDEFSTRFLRTAGLIAGAVGNNLSKVAGSIKTGIDDILYPDRRRPK